MYLNSAERLSWSEGIIDSIFGIITSTVEILEKMETKYVYVIVDRPTPFSAW